MADIHNQSRSNNFDDVVRESMELAYENIIITNNTPQRVHVRNRTGFIKTFNPTAKQDLNSVTIFTITAIRNPYSKSLEFKDNVENYCEAYLEKYNKVADSILDEVKIAYEKVIEFGKPIREGSLDSNKFLSNRGSRPVAVTDILYVVTKVSVPITMLADGKSVFLTNKNLVLSTKNIMDVEEHPCMTDNNPLSHVQESAQNNLFSVIVVDNVSQFSSRYAFMFGELVEIKPVRDLTRKDGLYIFFKKNGKADSCYISPENMEKSKYVFKSREEAVTGGDIGAAYTKAMNEVSHNNKMEEARLRQEEMKLKAKEIAGNEALAASKSELEKMKLELEKKRIDLDNAVAANKLKDSNNSTYFTERKYASQDHYDEKSRQRSESVEYVKTGATIVTAVIATGLLAAKLFSK